MKRKVAGLLLALFVFSLCGCGSGGASVSASAFGPSSQPFSGTTSSSAPSALPDSSPLSSSPPGYNPFPGLPFSPDSIVPSPSYEQPYFQTNVVTFTAGPYGTEQVTLKPGDTFLGLKVVRLLSQWVLYPHGWDMLSLRALFEGTVTLKGYLTLSHSVEDTLFYAMFYVSDEDASKLPCCIHDIRSLEFTFNDSTPLCADLGLDQCKNLYCEITIENYEIYTAHAGVANTADYISVRVL